VVSFTPRLLYLGESAPGSHWIGGLVDPQSRSRRLREQKILDSTGTGTPTTRSSSPLASHSTDYAIPAPHSLQLRSYISLSNISKVFRLVSVLDRTRKYMLLSSSKSVGAGSILIFLKSYSSQSQIHLLGITS
jgi:hypothetical protein